MRRHLKKRLYENIQTLSNMHTEVERLIFTQCGQDAIDLLCQCQECAIIIGNYIEENEGEGVKAVSLLEEYCEQVYITSMGIEDPSHVAKMILELDNQLDYIKVSIEMEIPEQLEIVFLPYKASMWDSLESIWLAAHRDSNCNCFVVPIPYFDKKTNGSISQMKYEGDEFPDYVSICSWESYNIEERMPDIVYIHNPYDEHNLVTTVHPNYYSKKLKQYTDMLVYVPYFVLLYGIPEHLCTAMGILSADRVIVQSEKIRDIYIKTYNQLLKEHNVLHHFVDANDKFLALGSPKFDKGLNTNRNNIQIMSEWEEKIGDKKVILYNTSISNLLIEKDKLIRKLKYVFACFKNRNDVVLLWRPHPLNISALDALVPDLLEEYQRLIYQYKQENWGIYDDTADVHRAIAISDGYYGDAGSMMPIYGITGKPIMQQAIDIDKEPTWEELSSHWFEDICIDKDDLYFFSGGMNCLFHTTWNSDFPEYLGQVPNEDNKIPRLYISMIKIDNKLILAPYAAREIAEYNLITKKFKKVKLQAQTESDEKCNYKFIQMIRHNNYVFFIPACYHAIIRYNILTEEYMYFTDWYQTIKGYIIDSRNILFRTSACMKENSILIPFCQSNIVIELNVETCNIVLHSVGKKGNQYSEMAYDGKFYWLTPRKMGPIVKWDYNSGKSIEYGKYPKGFQLDMEIAFNSIICTKGEILVFPAAANMVLNIDPETGKINEYNKLSSYTKENEMINSSRYLRTKYYFSKEYKGVVYALSTYGDQLLRFQAPTGNIESKSFYYMTDFYYRNSIEATYKHKRHKRLSSIKEYIFDERTTYGGLIGFLHYIKNYDETISELQTNTFLNLSSSGKGNAGIKIHQHMMQQFLE